MYSRPGMPSYAWQRRRMTPQLVSAIAAWVAALGFVVAASINLWLAWRG